MTNPTLRARLGRPPILIAPGVYDALTAHLAEQAGFTALYVSGAAIAYTRLGRSDIGLVAMSEVADSIAMIRDRVSSDLLVDAAFAEQPVVNQAPLVISPKTEIEQRGLRILKLDEEFQ